MKLCYVWLRLRLGVRLRVRLGEVRLCLVKVKVGLG